MENLRGENWTITLYPEQGNSQDMITLEYITSNFKYAYILHNKDINNETGELKKEHIHVVIKLENARTLQSIAKELNIEENRLERVRNLRKMIRYLVHQDNQEKYQYEIENIKTDMWEEIEKYFQNDSESYDILLIYEFIYTIDRYLYFQEVLEYVLKNNLYASYRRGANIINRIVEEHNKLFLERKECEKMEKARREKEIWEYERQATKKKAKNSMKA